MRATALFGYPGGEVVADLERMGIRVRPLRDENGLYYAELLTDEARKDHGQVIPQELRFCPDFKLAIKCQEPPCIHHDRKNGAMVLCDEQGQALRSYYIPREAEQPRLGLARFMADSPVVTVWRSPTVHTVAIERHAVCLTSDGNCAVIRQEPIWMGLADELPREFNRFRPALTVTAHKATCRRICVLPRPHFVAYLKM